MTRAADLLPTFPDAISLDKDLLVRCIDECVTCAQACTGCADADLSEEMVRELRKCIRICLDCADVCEVTSRVLTRQTAYDANVARAVVQACIQVSKSCGDECERHAAMHVHCRISAEECRRCEQVCREVLAAVG
jgi:Domain of Unknown Function (DUF326)